MMNKCDFQSVHEGLSRIPNLRPTASVFLRSLTLPLAKLPTMFYNEGSVFRRASRVAACLAVRRPSAARARQGRDLAGELAGTCSPRAHIKLKILPHAAPLPATPSAEGNGAT